MVCFARAKDGRFARLKETLALIRLVLTWGGDGGTCVIRLSRGSRGPFIFHRVSASAARVVCRFTKTFESKCQKCPPLSILNNALTLL